VVPERNTNIAAEKWDARDKREAEAYRGNIVWVMSFAKKNAYLLKIIVCPTMRQTNYPSYLAI
jgi:hypothetical protein